MKRPNDSMWETAPNTAYSAIIDSIDKDEKNGYLNRHEASRLRNRAKKLRDKNRKR